MSNPHTGEQRLRTIAINIRLADEPSSVTSLRLVSAAANLHLHEANEDHWPEGPPIVQLGSLERRGGYLRQVEGPSVGYVPAGDPGGAVMRVAPLAHVFGIDAPVDAANVGATGTKIRSIIEAGRAIGAWVVPYLVCSGHQVTEKQQHLMNSLLPYKVLPGRESDPRFEIVSYWRGIKNEATPDLPQDYLDARGMPLLDYLGEQGDETESSRFHLHVIIESMRGRGFINSLLRSRE